MSRLISPDCSNKRAPIGKLTRKASARNVNAETSRRRKRKRVRMSMIKRDESCLPDIGTLARLPLASSRAPLQTERSSPDDDLMVVVPSESQGSHRPISIGSGSRTPSDSSVVDLTNDSSLEDEGVVIDLTTSFQMPTTIGSPVVEDPPVSLGVEEEGRVPANSDVVIVQESDDEVQFIGSSGSNPSKSGLRLMKRATLSTTALSTAPSTSFNSPTSTKSAGKASITCPVCMDRASLFESMGRKLVTTTCGHVFCDECIKNAISSLHKCPVCNKRLTLRQYHRLFIS